MRTVDKTEIERWIKENQCYTDGSLAVKPQEIERTRRRKPWYQRQPKGWFKPIFTAMLVMRERWEAFAFIGLLAAVFGLCWAMTCEWLG